MPVKTSPNKDIGRILKNMDVHPYAETRDWVFDHFRCLLSMAGCQVANHRPVKCNRTAIPGTA
jgi:hypothetical protein